jgi:hypothetical protein
MATTVPAAPHLSEPDKGKRAERRFFFGYTLALAIVMLSGFLPSFYLRGVIPVGAPLRPLTPELIVHGLIGTVFVLLFPLQAWLISAGQRTLHMRVGKWGFVAGAALTATLYVIAALGYRSMADHAAAQAAIIASGPLLGVPILAALLWLAWGRRFDAPAHKRLMLAVAWAAAAPGLGRLMAWSPIPGMAALGPIFLLLIVLPLWLWDLASRRRPHWATLLGTLAFLGPVFARPVLVPVWPAVVPLVPGFGWP